MFALGVSKKAKMMEKDPESESDAATADTENKANNNHTEEKNDNIPAPVPSASKMSIRDKLLTKEIADLDGNLPNTCTLTWKDKDISHAFSITIRPDEGHWKNGTFQFDVSVPEQYNMSPPKIKCMTQIWHPNINEGPGGAVCLSILRQASIDEHGWSPTRGLRDVIWGVNSLFTDLLNFEDPLNGVAAKEFQEDPESFKRKVSNYIRRYCVAQPVNQANQYQGDEDEFDEY